MYADLRAVVADEHRRDLTVEARRSLLARLAQCCREGWLSRLRTGGVEPAVCC